MKRAVAILALAALMVGCGGPARAATPELTTPAGYRRGAIARAERVAGAVEAARTTCANATVGDCRRALRTQETVYRETPDLAPLGGRPLVCDHLAANYFILLNGAGDYFAQMNAVAPSDDPATLRQVGSERSVSFSQSQRAFNDALPTDSCQ